MVQCNTKQTPENIQVMEHSVLFSTIQTETQHYPFKKMQ